MPKNLVKGSGRRPDYDVRGMNKMTNERAKIGGAWLNSDGSISVVLEPFVTLVSSKDLVVTLFPRSERSDGPR